MRGIAWIFSGILLLGVAAGSVPATQETKDPCLKQRESFEKAKIVINGASVSYHAAVEKRKQAFDQLMKAEDDVHRGHETRLAASAAALKMQEAYLDCLEKQPGMSCAPQKKAADEAVLREARASRDEVFSEVEAFCAQMAMERAEAEIKSAGEAQRAAIRTLQEARTALAQCLRLKK